MLYVYVHIYVGKTLSLVSLFAESKGTGSTENKYGIALVGHLAFVGLVLIGWALVRRAHNGHPLALMGWAEGGTNKQKCPCAPGPRGPGPYGPGPYGPPGHLWAAPLWAWP